MRRIEEVRDLTEEMVDLLLLADPDCVHLTTYHNAVYFTVTDDKQIIGIVAIGNPSEDSFEILNLAIKESHENQGYGSFLLAFAEQYAKQNAKQILWIKTSTTSFKQLYLYQKMGFRCVQIVPNYFSIHYSTPLFENKLRVQDQIILKKNCIIKNRGVDVL